MTTQETTTPPAPVATTDVPDLSGDWIAWRARFEEKLEHMSTKTDLERLRTGLEGLKTDQERLKVWMILTSLSVGALIVAAVKVIP